MSGRSPLPKRCVGRCEDCDRDVTVWPRLEVGACNGDPIRVRCASCDGIALADPSPPEVTDR